MKGTAWGLEVEPAVVMPWADSGLCRQLVAEGMDPDVWYPAEQGLEHRNVRQAISLCGQCPVWRECREHAIERHEKGIWGGTTERTREKERKRRSRAKYRAAEKAKAAS